MFPYCLSARRVSVEKKLAVVEASKEGRKEVSGNVLVVVV